MRAGRLTKPELRKLQRALAAINEVLTPRTPERPYKEEDMSAEHELYRKLHAARWQLRDVTRWQEEFTGHGPPVNAEGMEVAA